MILRPGKVDVLNVMLILDLRGRLTLAFTFREKFSSFLIFTAGTNAS